MKEITGQKFGYLTVLGFHERRKNDYFWKCKCDCGNISIVNKGHLNSGRTISCGCYRLKKMTKHGENKKRLYKIWNSMKKRCLNPNDQAYEYYGGRGIIVCDEWKNSYEAFRDWALVNGYKNNLSIDRINNSKGYSPDNCRWATMKEQSNNTRRNRIITHNNETHTIAQWNEILGFPKKLIYNRLQRGWAIEKTLSTKPQVRS